MCQHSAEILRFHTIPSTLIARWAHTWILVDLFTFCWLAEKKWYGFSLSGWKLILRCCSKGAFFFSETKLCIRFLVFWFTQCLTSSPTFIQEKLKKRSTLQAMQKFKWLRWRKRPQPIGKTELCQMEDGYNSPQEQTVVLLTTSKSHSR